MKIQICKIKKEIWKIYYKNYQAFQQSYFNKCYKLVLHDLRYGYKNLFVNISETSSGGRHSKTKSIQESIEFLDLIFGFYRSLSGIDKFYGKVAEIGPGDSAGIALYFINDGVEQVDLADRFYSQRDSAYINQLHKEIIFSCKDLTNQYKNFEITSEDDLKNITRYYGSKASAENFFKHNKGYDFIVSSAVLEHLYDPLKAINLMINALNDKGMLIHLVDLKDHGMFSKEYHELKFLENPRYIHKLMTCFSGRPNRVLLHEYRKLLEKTGLEYEIYIFTLAGVGKLPMGPLPYEKIPEELRQKSLNYIRSVRNNFDCEFKNVSDEDLSISYFGLVVKNFNEEVCAE